jgi:hypothetical protein
MEVAMTNEEAFRLLRLARLAQVGAPLTAADSHAFLDLAQRAMRTHPDSLEAMRLLRLARSTARDTIANAQAFGGVRQA